MIIEEVRHGFHSYCHKYKQNPDILFIKKNLYLTLLKQDMGIFSIFNGQAHYFKKCLVIMTDDNFIDDFKFFEFKDLKENCDKSILYGEYLVINKYPSVYEDYSYFASSRIPIELASGVTLAIHLNYLEFIKNSKINF